MKLFRFLNKSFSEREKELIKLLSKGGLFDNLTEDEIAQFIPHLFLRQYKHNEVIFFTSDPSQALYVVKSGMISLNLELKDGFEKLLTLKKGRIFGDNSMLEKTRRLYTAIVETELAEVYTIPQINLFEIMNDHPAIKAKMMTNFAEMHNQYASELIKAYKSSFGFFELNTVYRSL
ncbi:MAG: cyclic nucleotide-binding domain-containing protein [Cyclobacteriaceae bacterium]